MGQQAPLPTWARGASARVTTVVLARQGDRQHHHVCVNVCAAARACVRIGARASEPACPCTSVHGSGTRKLCAPVGIESVTVPASPAAAQGGQGVQPGDTVAPLPLRMPVVAGHSANKCATHPPWAGHTRLHTHLEVCGCVCVHAPAVFPLAPSFQNAPLSQQG